MTTREPMFSFSIVKTTLKKKSEEKLNNRVNGGELGLLAKNVFRLRYFLFRVYFFHCLGSTL